MNGLLRTQWTGGGLGNQLYWPLQAYVRSTATVRYRYLINECGRKCGFEKAASTLNMDRYVTLAARSCEAEVVLTSPSYQRYGVDFSRQQLESFISETVLKANAFEAMKRELRWLADTRDVLCLHIRNGDYIRYPNRIHWACFDREQYFTNSFELIGAERFRGLDVISDDNGLNKRLYDDLFRRYFHKVNYLPVSSPCDDLMRLSLYHDKVIMNSTFSYWGAFIGDSIYTDATTIAPNFFTRREADSSNCAPHWTIVDVKIDRLRFGAMILEHNWELLKAALTLRPVRRKLGGLLGKTPTGSVRD